jgi:hypothetical protein
MCSEHGGIVYDLLDPVDFETGWKLGLAWLLMIVFMIIAGGVLLAILIQGKF